MSISLAHSGYNAGVTVAEIDLSFLNDFLGDAEVGKATHAYIVDGKGEVLANSSNGPEIGRNLASLPQVAAVMAPDGVARASGKDAGGNAVLTASAEVPKLGWHVFFEQPTAQALAPIRDQLVRIALLIALGLVVAIIAGTIMARRMLVPITALRAGARRLGAGDFAHRIEVQDRGRAGRTGKSVQQHGRPAGRNLFRPRRQGEGAHARPRAIDQRAEGARGSRPRGRLLARPQRRAADGRRARARNHPCRRRADLWL